MHMQCTRILSRLFLFTLMAAAMGCSSSSDSADGGTIPTVANGGACADDSECIVGTCIAELPKGYCAAYCTSNEECQEGTYCTQATHTQFACLATCKAKHDCREGYVCGFHNVCT